MFKGVKVVKGIKVVQDLSGSTASEVTEYDDLLKIFKNCFRISHFKV